MAEDCLNRAMALQQSANWLPVKAVNECRLALRGMASEWYMGFVLAQAECYKNFYLFIAAFKKFTEITDKQEDLIAQTAELKKKANEKVTIFYVRCRRAIMKHLQAASNLTHFWRCSRTTLWRNSALELMSRSNGCNNK